MEGEITMMLLFKKIVEEKERDEDRNVVYLCPNPKKFARHFSCIFGTPPLYNLSEKFSN